MPRFGLRRHYRLAPWTDLVEVHWSAGAEAYVTPVADDLVGVAILGGAHGDFASRLAAFPALRERLAGAGPGSEVRGAGPLRQDVPRRSAGNVLLVGDASGYLDALTGEGIGAALAQAAVLAECLAAGRPGDYERAWRRACRRSWMLTAGLLWSRHQPLLGPAHRPRRAATPPRCSPQSSTWSATRDRAALGSAAMSAASERRRPPADAGAVDAWAGAMVASSARGTSRLQPNGIPRRRY